MTIELHDSRLARRQQGVHAVRGYATVDTTTVEIFAAGDNPAGIAYLGQIGISGAASGATAVLRETVSSAVHWVATAPANNTSDTQSVRGWVPPGQGLELVTTDDGFYALQFWDEVP